MKWNKIVILCLLFLPAAMYVVERLHAQSGNNVSVFAPVGSLAQCAWPQQYAAGTPGLALCPIVSGTTAQLAIAANGGAFVLVGGSGGQQGPQGPQGPPGPAGPQGPPSTFTTLNCATFTRSGATSKQTGCTEAQ